MPSKKRKISKISEIKKSVTSSKKFGDLKNKAQIFFIDPSYKNILNRQTHTKQVAKISAQIARELGEDEELAELMGLCHDLGHTPFGHDGEYVLNEIAKSCKYNAERLQAHYNQSNPLSSFNIGFIRKVSQEQPQKKEDSKEQIESSFEHHEHSLRVLNSILDSENIGLDYDLRIKLMSGVLGHSESRETPPKDRVAQIPRIADKFYAFSDLSDMVNCGVKVDVRTFFEKMNQKGCFPVKQKNSEEILVEEPSEEDLLNLEQIVADAENRKDFLDIYMQKYVEDIVSASKNANKVDVSKDMRKKMEYLKALTKFMRQEMIVEKEEGLAQRMVNEVWAYMVENIDIEKYLSNGMKANKKIEAVFLVASLTDKEIIDMYKSISKNKEWVARVERGEIKLNAVDKKKPYDEQQVRLLRQKPEIVRYMNIQEEYEKLKTISAKGKAPSEITERIDSLGSTLKEYDKIPHKERALDRLKIKMEILEMKEALVQQKSFGQAYNPNKGPKYACHTR